MLRSAAKCLILASTICLAAAGGCTPAASLSTEAHPTELPGLIAFWDFQEPAGQARMSVGRYRYALREMNGPIRRAEDGVFGPYSADLEWGQWFRAPRAEVPGLNLHGDPRPLSMVAWVQRESDRVWQYIAGVWNEGSPEFQGKSGGTGPGAPSRQYAIFVNGARQTDHTTYERIPALNQVHGYVSPFGGATPEHPFAFDYATGGTALETGRWYMIAYTFDGEVIRVYVDGRLDENRNYNPFHYHGPVFDGGENGTDFTVALRDHPQWPTYPEGLPENEEGFDGRIGGLAVYNRALTSQEIAALYRSSLRTGAEARRR
jgi:hypothetical protein